MIHTGDLLDGKYRILGEIGRGGMSVVYLAINDRANKTWAVKEIRKDGNMDPANMSMGLMAETEMLKKLRHRNLPGIVDVIDSEESFIIVMDYIEGRSAADILKTEGPQPEERVVGWAKELTSVLAYLHGRNPPIIYRDMKPGNIIVKPDGTISLVDFGTAREYKYDRSGEDTVCLGTRGYAAPEQFGGTGQTDARTDIYCLGTTLYHLLTGRDPARPPYEIKPIGFFVPSYRGTGLEKLIVRCTRQDPDERYQDCGELKEALEHYKDEDDERIMQKRRRIRRSVISLAAGCAALACAVFFKCSADEARRNSYMALVERGAVAESLKEAAGYFNKAMEMDAGEPLAYEKLLEKAGDTIAEDGGLSSADTAVLNSCLYGNVTDSGSNIDVLKEKDPEAFTEIMYEIGLWYFFLKDNTLADRRNAGKYFSQISGEPYSGYLDESRREMQRIISGIAAYSGSLNSDLGKIGSGTEKGWSDLFRDMKEMVSGDLKAKVGKDYYVLAVYEQAAYWINRSCGDFYGDGIGKDEISEVLDIIEYGIESLGIGEENMNYEEYNKARSAAAAARDITERIRE